MDWLDTLIILLCCIIEIFLLYDYFANFFEIKIEDKHKKILCISAVGAIFAANLLNNNILNLLFVPLVLWTFVTVVFDAKIGIRFVYFFLVYSVMIGVEFLYIILSNTTSELLINNGLISASEHLWELLVIKFLNYIVFLILKQSSSKSKSRITNRLFMIYLCVPISTLGTMLTVFYSGMDVGSNNILKVLMTLFFVFMVFGNMLLFYAFQKYTENLSENAKQQLELLYQKAEIERLAKISELNDNYNEMAHNASHFLKVIDQLAYEENYDEIIRIVERLNGRLNRENIYGFCNQKMLNIILSEYASKAHKANVNFDVYVEPGCVLSHIKDEDLITMLGNILDNALRAASDKGMGSLVRVRIFAQKNGKLCVIKVTNEFAGKLKEVGGKLISTKNENGIHGIGLSSVARIIEQYDGYLEHYIEKGVFVSVIVLPVKVE